MTLALAGIEAPILGYFLSLLPCNLPRRLLILDVPKAGLVKAVTCRNRCVRLFTWILQAPPIQLEILYPRKLGTTCLPRLRLLQSPGIILRYPPKHPDVAIELRNYEHGYSNQLIRLFTTYFQITPETNHGYVLLPPYDVKLVSASPST